mgnify:FL=1|jgi:hypothetical protein
MSSMKMSKDTLSVLKNFSQINSNLLVKPGNRITTVSPAKNIVCEANVSEHFNVQFGIFDLSKFLGTVSLFEDAEFVFGEKSMQIHSDSGAKISYYYSEPRLLTTLDREVNMPEPVVSFVIKEHMFENIKRSAAVLQLSDLCIQSNDEGKIELVVLEKKTPTTNSYVVEVGDNDTGASFSFYLKIDNLKLLSGDYKVDICESTVSRFSHNSMDVVYYIALEHDSTYTK